MSRRAASITTIVLVLAIVVGAVVRVTGISTRTMFSDETFSVLRITGHTEAALRTLIDDRVRPMSEVAAFQRVDAHTSPAATLESIGTEEPQRGPLYYTIATLWLNVGGTSIAGLRSLAVLIGILAIAAAFFFGTIAFRNTTGGAIVAALVALSPFHLAYARQAREYGLFTLLIFLSAATLLAAIGRPAFGRWLAFAASCALGLLSTPLFALVLVSYAGYAGYALARRSLDMRGAAFFAGALVAAAIAVAPWYLYVARVSGKVVGETSWGDVVYPATFYLAKVVFEFGAVFFDAEFGNLKYGIALAFVFAAAIYLVVCAVRANGDAIVFALALAVPTALVLVANDVRVGAHFATIARYATPVWVALEIAVAAGAAAALRATGREQRAGLVALAILLGSGGFCALTDFRHHLWWDNNDNVPVQAVADAANAQPRAIVIASQLPLTLVLVHYLREPVRIQLYAEHAVPTLSTSGQPNMLFAPFADIRDALEKRTGAALRPAIALPGASVAGTFHVGLERSGGFADKDALEVNSPRNALWIVPASPRGRG